MEANKSAVGVAMQWLVFIDKVHDMHGSKQISRGRSDAVVGVH